MNSQQTTRRGRSGVTMIEAVMSLVVVSGAMAAALNAVSGARVSQVTVDERARAGLLAESLLAEVLAHDYAEPGATKLGPDAGETGAANRLPFDDVDDYAGWIGKAIDRDGTVISGFEAYSIAFDVVWVRPANPLVVVNADEGVKRITVTVLRGARTVAELVGYKAAP